MFTGLIEEIGKIRSIKTGIRSYQMGISATKVMDGTQLGDSICTNGACLTVVEIASDGFTVDVMSETLANTSFSELKIGSKVNLERAMRLNDRIGGHLVSGHIDGIGTISSIEKDDIAWRLKIKARKEILQQMMDKGSVAIDGISLTIVRVESTEFEVSIIPLTAQETTLMDKKVNDTVNLEIDMIGKYVFRFLNQHQQQTKQPESKVDMGFLAKNGFLT